jgi:hypothetical protein
MWEQGKPQFANDTVKLVCSGEQLHAYSISSIGYSSATCSACGAPILV